MVVLRKKSKSQVNKNIAKKSDGKKVKYVWIASRKAIFLVIDDPKESKYSYGVTIQPLYGYYKSDGKSYTPKELSDYQVILNVKKDDELLKYLKKGKVVIIGYSEDDVIIVEGGEE